MRYILNESKFNSIIDKIIYLHYGEPLVMYEDVEGYLLFFPQSEIEPYLNSGSDIPKHFYDTCKFSRNLWGKLWVNDSSLIHNIISVLGMSEEKSKKVILDYFKQKYNTHFKDWAIEDY
jgi:hypothetical protein